MEQNITTEKEILFLGKKIKGITGSTLKIIAIVCMFIDHSAVALIEPLFYRGINNSFIPRLYKYMRAIGRLGFLIFCFLLVEGFIYTRNRVHYVIRLGIFALISEVPFDLGLMGKLSDNTHQNVFFTLFIGMIVIIIVDKLRNTKSIPTIINVIACVSILILAMYVARLLRTDYDASGVLTIFIMYLLRNYKTAEIYAGCMTQTLFNLFEAYSFLAVIPIALYNGKRGLRIKYFFYIFYPAHILILAGIARLIY